MPVPKLKICGITNLADARYLAGAGVDYLGFRFNENDSGYIEPAQAGAIVNWLEGPMKVGIFGEQPLDEINQIAQSTGIDFVQLSGGQSPEFCFLIEKPVIKTIHVSASASPEELAQQVGMYSEVSEMLRFELENPLADISPAHISIIKKCDSYILSGNFVIEEGIRVLQPAIIEINENLDDEDGLLDYDKVETILEKLA